MDSGGRRSRAPAGLRRSGLRNPRGVGDPRAHGGIAAGRTRSARPPLPGSGRTPPRPPSHYLPHNVYVPTSGVFSHAALLGATHAVGIDRVLFAIDYPWESTAEAVEFLRTAPYAPADLERVAHGNAERILRL